MSTMSMWVMSLTYCVLLVAGMVSADFISIWLLVELSTVVFFCMSLMWMLKDCSSLMVYYLIQSFFSISMMLLWVSASSAPNTITTTLSFLCWLMKLGLAPMGLWYFYSTLLLPTPVLLLTLTTQKLLPLSLSPYLLTTISPSMVIILICSSAASLMLLYSATSMTNLLVVSSIYNLVWLIMSSVVSMPLMVTFLFVYSMLVTTAMIQPKYMSVVMYTLMGFPPMPLFFMKLAVVYYSLSLPFPSVSLLLFWLLLMNSIFTYIYFSTLSTTVKSKMKSSMM